MSTYTYPRYFSNIKRSNKTLTKVENSNLIPSYADAEARKPSMWGDMQPTEADIQQLAARFVYEWTTAVNRMLQHWQAEPTWY